jgi:hypothetical protein
MSSKFKYVHDVVDLNKEEELTLLLQKFSVEYWEIVSVTSIAPFKILVISKKASTK